MKLASGIEYEGTDYHGFHRQADDRGLTIQGTLEAAIARISGETSVVYGAGRTDAGVHASGQVIHFCTDAALASQVWMRALNANLPKTVAVRWVKEVPNDFHARYSARSRSYRYTIWNDVAPTPLRARYSYHRPQALAVSLMDQACQFLLGRRDFGAFGHSPDQTNPLKPGPHSCMRTMLEASCKRHESLTYGDFTAESFLTGVGWEIFGTLLFFWRKRFIHVVALSLFPLSHKKLPRF